MSFHLADLFEVVAGAVPDREAIVCGDRRITYAELDERAARVGGALVDAGIRPGDRVGVALRNRVEHVELLLGAFKVRAVPVNVNYRYQRDELRHVLADSGARVLVHETDVAEHVDSLRGQLPGLDTTLVPGEPYESWVRASEAAPLSSPRPEDDPYMIYTGGTTGSPKGVVWRHVDVFFAALGGGIGAGERIDEPRRILDGLAHAPRRALPASPLMHGTAQWFTLLTLLAGGTVVLSPEATFDPVRLLDLMEREAVSYLQIVGDAFAAPLVAALTAEPERWDLDDLTVVLSGGAMLSTSVRRALLDQLPWIVVVDSYGTSETGGQAAAVHAAGSSDRVATRSFEPRSGTSVLAADLRPVEPGSGAVGRIARAGHIPLGYHDDPVATEATFPVVDGTRWALTGDHATVAPDGRIVLLGRGSATINSGGEKIHPEEVEAVLRDHAAVYDAVVVGVPDDRWGERVAAIVVPRDGVHVGFDELVEHCRARLADFKAPRSAVFVERIVRLESGKPDYRWATTVASTEPDTSST